VLIQRSFCSWESWLWTVHVCHYVLPWMGILSVLNHTCPAFFKHIYALVRCWDNTFSRYWAHKRVLISAP
jgi:hypothetical protein